MTITDTRDMVLSQFLRRRVPPPVRLLYRLTGRRAFTRETAALRAALAAPSRTA